MGIRFYMGRVNNTRVVIGAILITLFFSVLNLGSASAAKLTAEERKLELEKQQAQEAQTKAKKASDNQQAQQKVEAEQQQEAPAQVTGLKATTSESTTGIKATKAAKGYRYVTLKWDKAETATRYFVYYSTKKDGTFKVRGKETTKTKSKLLFKNTKEVFLKVMAYNGEVAGPLSEYVVIWPGYGEQVNAMNTKMSTKTGVMFAGLSKKFKLATTASMLKTYKTKWSSSNTEVAKVSSSGKVTAVAAGNAVITATTHTGQTLSQDLLVKKADGKGVPDLRGLSKSEAKQILKAKGFKASFNSKYIRKKDLKKKYPGAAMGTVMTQNYKAGTTLPKGTTVKATISDEIYDCGVGVEAMVKWAEAVAADNRYGYSMGVYTGRGLDRLCPYTNSGASKDYDCATFVNAALAFSGMGADYMQATHKPSPVVGGVKAIMVKNGWKKILIKTKKGYRKPYVSELKRGDIVLDVRRHIQIHAGNGMDVGAHNNYDGKSGDSSGREISVNYSWTGYAEAYRYKGDIGKK